MNNEIEVALALLGAEPLAGSGFEGEQPEPDFGYGAPAPDREQK